MSDPAPTTSVTPTEMSWRGIELCRREEWQEGLDWLGQAAESTYETSELPSQFFAYLGYGLVRFQGDKDQGLKLCQRSVDLDFYEPENYYLLARTHLILDDRRSANSVLEKGLQIDPTHPGLIRLRYELGRRRPPVVFFLSRRHVLNRLLGRVRHRLLGGRPPRDA